MKTGLQGIELIKLFEGLSFRAYLCPAGVLTIGYGTTKNVQKGMKITLEQAEELLRLDLLRFENYLNKKFGENYFSQNEFDALVSFVYNLGSISGTLLKSLKENNKKLTITMLSKYVKGGGKYLLGLHRRRLCESYIFSGLNIDKSKLYEIRHKFSKEQIDNEFKIIEKTYET